MSKVKFNASTNTNPNEIKVGETCSISALTLEVLNLVDNDSLDDPLATYDGLVTNESGYINLETKIGSRMTHLLNLGSDDIDAFNGVNIMHHRGKFDRMAFTKGELATQTDNDGGTIYRLRTRPNIKLMHLIKSADRQLSSVDTLELTDPIIVGAMANTTKRKQILDTVCDLKFQEAIRNFIMGTGRYMSKEQNIYTSIRMYHKVAALMNQGGDPLTNDVVLTVGRLVLEVLAQFGWQFATIDVFQVKEPSVRVMRESDIEEKYIEGWIAQRIPEAKRWVMSYNGDSKVTPGAVDEILASSFIQLKKMLMEINLLSNRVKDVLKMVTLKAAFEAGLVPEISNETIMACLTASPDIADMATWYAISGNYFSSAKTMKILATYQQLSTGIGDVNLFLKHAADVAMHVREHKLVESMLIGDFVKHLSVRNYVSGDGHHYHTHIYGDARSVNNQYYHYIEDTVGTNGSQAIYSHLRIRENDALTGETSRAIESLVAPSMQYLGDESDIMINGDLAQLTSPDKWGKAPHYLTITNCTTDELRVLALLNFDLIVSYVVSKSEASVIYSVVDVHYIIGDLSKTLINPYPLLEGDVYSSCVLAALAFVGERASSGANPILAFTLDEVSAKYLSSPLGTVGSRFITSNVPLALSSTLIIRDEQGGARNVTVNLPTEEYMVVNNAGATIAFIPDTLNAQSALVNFALDRAKSKATFKNLGIALGVDDERVRAQLLNQAFDIVLNMSLVRQLQYDIKFSVSRQLSNVVASWSSLYHNINVNAAAALAACQAPFAYVWSTSQTAAPNWFEEGLKHNRLFKDWVIGKVTKDGRK